MSDADCKNAVQCHRELPKAKPSHASFCDTTFVAVLCVCGKREHKILRTLFLDHETLRQHLFLAVTLVLQVLLELRVIMFRVSLFWSGSDTYPVCGGGQDFVVHTCIFKAVYCLLKININLCATTALYIVKLELTYDCDADRMLTYTCIARSIKNT